MKYGWSAPLLVAAVLWTSAALAVQKQEGIVKIPSNHSVDETVDKLKTILQSKGVKLFALIDHSGAAEKVGLKMPPTKLLIFGNPKGGTPADAGRSERRHRPSSEDFDRRRSPREGMDLLQQLRIPESTA
jgi:Domain of unknown function DUF302